MKKSVQEDLRELGLLLQFGAALGVNAAASELRLRYRVSRSYARSAARYAGKALRMCVIGVERAPDATTLHAPPLNELSHPSQICTHHPADGCPPECPWRQVQCVACDGSGYCQRCGGDAVDPDKGAEAERFMAAERERRFLRAFEEIGTGGAP